MRACCEMHRFTQKKLGGHRGGYWVAWKREKVSCARISLEGSERKRLPGAHADEVVRHIAAFCEHSSRKVFLAFADAAGRDEKVAVMKRIMNSASLTIGVIRENTEIADFYAPLPKRCFNQM